MVLLSRRARVLISESTPAEPAAAADSLRSAALAAEPQAVRPLCGEAASVTRKHFNMRGIVFSLFGLASLFVAATIAHFEFMALAIGLACFLIAASSFSNAGQLAPSLRPFVKHPVRVEVWGASLPATTAPLFELDSVSAVGEGLLIHLRAISGGPGPCSRLPNPDQPDLGHST